MTAYALLVYSHNRDMSNALPIAKWIIAQRNPNGGFSSTQVTIYPVIMLCSQLVWWSGSYDLGRHYNTRANGSYSVRCLGHGRSTAGAGAVCKPDSDAIWWQRWTWADCYIWRRVSQLLDNFTSECSASPDSAGRSLSLTDHCVVSTVIVFVTSVWSLCSDAVGWDGIFII